MSNSNLKIILLVATLISISRAGYYYKTDIESYVYKNFTKMECTLQLYGASADDIGIRSNVVADKIIISLRIAGQKTVSQTIRSRAIITFAEIQTLLEKNYTNEIDMVVVEFTLGMQKIQYDFNITTHKNMPYKLKYNDYIIDLIKMEYTAWSDSIRLNVVPDLVRSFLKDEAGKSVELAALHSEKKIGMAQILALLSTHYSQNPGNKWKEVTLWFQFADQTIECPFEIRKINDSSYEIHNEQYKYKSMFQVARNNMDSNS